MNVSNIVSKVNALSREVGSYMRAEQEKLKHSDINSKGLHDYVTHVDKNSERMLVDALSVIIPDAGFLVEENTIDNTHQELTWIVDPLDGTTNFIHGLPVFSISIGLLKGQEMIMGSVLDVRADECFYAIKDGPAYCNEHEIRVSTRPSLAESLLATGFPYNDFHRQEEYLQMLGYLMQNCRGIRRYGSAAIDLAWVACGRFDGFWEYSLKPWDVAAGSFIVQQAGGKCSDFSGESDFIFGSEILCGNPRVYDELLVLVKRHFE